MNLGKAELAQYGQEISNAYQHEITAEFLDILKQDRALHLVICGGETSGSWKNELAQAIAFYRKPILERFTQQQVQIAAEFDFETDLMGWRLPLVYDKPHPAILIRYDVGIQYAITESVQKLENMLYSQRKNRYDCYLTSASFRRCSLSKFGRILTCGYDSDRHQFRFLFNPSRTWLGYVVFDDCTPADYRANYSRERIQILERMLNTVRRKIK